MSPRLVENDRQGKAAAEPEVFILPVATVSGTEVSPVLKSHRPHAGLNGRRAVLGVCVFLAVLIWLVFGQTVHHGFVNLDDDTYVYENPPVQAGLTLGGIGWAFSTVHASNWHPMTWVSHMLDCQFYGLNAGGHHLTNVLLHTATAILLFLVLRRMTGFLWRSAFVAAVFAIHPLRVESVAWIAERKDVLSGLFCMLTLWAWVRYVEQSKVQSPKSKAPYCLALFFFALGLMCKPMLVTLPLVLLLLDYWPMQRFNRSSIPHLVLEKLPFFGVAAASGLVTLFAQGKAISSLPLSQRIGNALVSCVVYLGQMFYPAGLAVFYPHPESGLALWKIVAAIALLLAISSLVFAGRRKRPWLLTGWVWYLLMLIPVIGILQVGAQAHADRYTYLPQIGLYVLLTWMAADRCSGWRRRRLPLVGGAVAILIALVFCAHAQTAYWRNSESLWTRALDCTANNIIAHNNFGNDLFQRGKVDEAIVQYQAALQLKPDHAEAHYNLGNALMRKGNVEEAIAHFQSALESKPDDAKARYNLAVALLQKGNMDQAIDQFRQVLQIKPDDVVARNNLGNALFQNGAAEEAVAQFQKVLQLKPEYAEAHFNLGYLLLQTGRLDEAVLQFQMVLQFKPDNEETHYQLGNALFQKGKVDEAMVQYQKAVQINPDYSEAQNNLAWLLATAPRASLRNGNQAVEHALRANRLARGADPDVLGTLAAAYAEAGRFDDARQNARQAIELARTAGQSEQVTQLNIELKLYEAKLPFHQESK